jgi:hypothetical protein
MPFVWQNQPFGAFNKLLDEMLIHHYLSIVAEGLYLVLTLDA